MFIAGIDGGGTHTRLEIRDSRNCLLRREQFGPFNLNSTGESAFRTTLREVFAACGSMDRCSRLCIGGAGISNPKVAEILKQELLHSGFIGKWKLVGDQEIALRGALEGPGAILIAGTGSICMGKDGQGRMARSGGFGHIIDDGGSGYALGRDLLSLAVQEADGRLPGAGILPRVLEFLQAEDTDALVSFVYSPDTTKAHIASLARLTLLLAEEGCPQALSILSQGAAQLRQMAQAVLQNLSLEGGSTALLGGLLSRENLYRETVLHTLSPICRPCLPLHDALWGAAQMAWEL